MNKIDVTEEELEEVAGGARHEELIASLQKIAERPVTKLDGIEKMLGTVVAVLSKIQQKDMPDIDLKPLAESIDKSIQELRTAFSSRPKSFTIKRDSSGLIEKITPEY